MPATQTPGDETRLLTHFNRAAARLDNITNMFYLSEYASDLSRLFRNSMRQAVEPATRQGMVNTMTNVMEIIGTGSSDPEGISNTLSVEAQTGALKTLSKALFKKTDPGLIPADFPANMARIAAHTEQSARHQNHVVRAMLENKARTINKIVQKSRR